MTTFQDVCTDKCRPLGWGERNLASRVFKSAVNLSRVRIHNHAHPEKSDSNAHTVGNDIFMPTNGFEPGNNSPKRSNYYAPDYGMAAPLWRKAVFIHELAHVWQYQAGWRATIPLAKARRNLGKKGYAKTLIEFVQDTQRQLGRNLPVDLFGRDLPWNTNPVAGPPVLSGITTSELPDGGKAVRFHEKEVRLSEQYVARFNRNATKYRMPEKGVRDTWAKNADYDYLYSIDKRSGEKAFYRLNLEAQAEMIKDYFLLSKGMDPAMPLVCDKGQVVLPKMGKERLPLSVYERVIPFL